MAMGMATHQNTNMLATYLFSQYAYASFQASVEPAAANSPWASSAYSPGVSQSSGSALGVNVPEVALPDDALASPDAVRGQVAVRPVVFA